MTLSIVLLCLIFGLASISSKTLSRPLAVHVVFRHGERTPDAGSFTYPTDPYQNETIFYPYGFGQLTIKGKQTQYNLGAFLRSRYYHLIHNLYAPNVVYGRSSDWDRTKMSLQLVMAGLFPPQLGEIWNYFVNWQPLAYDYKPFSEDTMIYWVNIPARRQAYEAHMQNLTAQGFFQPYQEIFAYLEEHSGWPMTNFQMAYYLYFALSAQRNWGLELPLWTQSVYPDVLRDMVIQHQVHMVGTDALKTIVTGELLQKIVTDTRAKIDGTITPKDRSIFLYSGHSTNLDTTLRTLGIVPPELPGNDASILFEVHRRKGVVGFELYYKKGTETSVIPLTVPGCQQFCALESFVSLFGQYFPNS